MRWLKFFLIVILTWEMTSRLLKENIRVAGQLLLSSEKEVKEIAGFVENGEVFDESAAILSVQNFCFAQRFLKIFQDKLKNLEKLRAASMV